MQTETALYEQIARYLNLQYPKAIYHFDLSGVNNPSGRSRALYARLNARAWPDLYIAKAVMYDGTINPCAGLFLELKREGTRLKRKTDGAWASTHIFEQAAVLSGLRDEGYYAEFAVGFDEAKYYIDSYLHGNIGPQTSSLVRNNSIHEATFPDEDEDVPF